MGVKIDRNGFMTEDGLVAFYRTFGNLGDDVEASGVGEGPQYTVCVTHMA